MKKILLLTVLLLTCTLHPCCAQTGKYYIDGREATRDEVLQLSAQVVESMSNSVEDGQPVVRIVLKPGARAANPAAVSAAPKPGTAQAAPAEKDPQAASASPTKTAAQRKAGELLRRIYDEHTRLKEGDPAAAFTAEKFAGGSVDLASLRGKVVLLNFWATWCGPCLRELAPEALPEVILRRFADRADFVFLPVAYTDSKASLEKFFASDKAANYAYLSTCTLMDPDKRIYELFAEQGIPRSFVIGRDGRIVLGSLGAVPEELERIASAIEAQLMQK